MLTRDNGEVESESEEMPPLVDCSDEEIAYPVEREALVIRRALNMQIKEDDVDQQFPTSIPHIVKGLGDVKLNRGTGGALILPLYTQHLWHFLS